MRIPRRIPCPYCTTHDTEGDECPRCEGDRTVEAPEDLAPLPEEWPAECPEGLL